MAIHIVHVEDDKALRNILAVSFRTAEPLANLKQFADSDQALTYIQENGEDIDLYVLDIRLPGALNGLQLAQKIRELKLPGYIVLSSAYSSPSREVLSELRCEFYPKPWHILELTHKLLKYHLDNKPSLNKPTEAPPTPGTPAPNGVAAEVPDRSS